MPTIEHEISLRPDFALLTAKLQAGQKIFAEPSAMASMDTNIKMKAGFKGGLLKSIFRSLGGESLIVNTFTGGDGGGEVTFAPGPMGDLVHYELTGANNILMQRGAWVANSEGVEVDGKWGGAKGFFSGKGMILLKASGQGDLFFNTYGALIDIDVSGSYYVDTGFIVAFEDTLDYDVTVLPGLSTGGKIKSFLFGGEGLVCRFSGQGKLWLQTRNVVPFINWIQPYRPVQRSSGG